MLHDTILNQKKVDYRREDNLNDSRIKQPFWSAQASCGTSAIFPGVPVFFNLQEGNPDVVIAVILIAVSDRGKERCRDNKVSLLTKMHSSGDESPNLPSLSCCEQRGSSLPLFSPSQQSALSLPGLFASSLSSLTSYSHPL